MLAIIHNYQVGARTLFRVMNNQMIQIKLNEALEKKGRTVYWLARAGINKKRSSLTARKCLISLNEP